MPPLDGAGYLVGYLFTPGEAGIVMATGMGGGPITHGEIRAWMANTGMRLAPWECRFLVRASQAYLSELHRAEKLGAQPPWRAPDAKPEPTAAQLAIRALAQG